MDVLTLGIFALLLICLAIVITVLLKSKTTIGFLDRDENPQRRRYLISGFLSVIAIAVIGTKIQLDDADGEQIVICDGWILKKKDLRPNACKPKPIG